MKLMCALWLAVVVSLVGVQSVYAQEDVTPPVLLDVRFEPAIIDTRYSDQVITVTARISDDLAGLFHADIRFRKPGTTQTNYLVWYISDNDPVVDVQLVGTMTMPRYSARGAWEMYLVQMSDKVGNQIVHFRDDASEPWPELYNGFTFTVASIELSQHVYLPILTP